MNRTDSERVVTLKAAIRHETIIATVCIWVATIGLILVLGMALCYGGQVRSPKDAGDASRLNKPMVKQVQPPLPPGYSPTTVAAAPAPLAVTVLAVPSAPYDILPPLISATNICFPVLSQFTNAVILCSTDLVHWTPLTNFCGMSERMYFKLKH